MGKSNTPTAAQRAANVARAAAWRASRTPEQIAAINARAAEIRKSRAGCDKARESNRRNQLRKYGLTPGDADRMYADQGGKCACCRETIQPHGHSKHTCVDHCHTTGKVRGLLCIPCNLGLGHAKDSLTRLQQMADYLKAHL